MAIQLTPENPFEFEKLSPSLSPDDLEVKRYYLESLDPLRQAEKWADRMFQNLKNIASNKRGECFIGYFYRANDFHRITNEIFSKKLGIEPLPNTDLEHFVITFDSGHGLDLFRRGLVYESDSNSPDAIEYRNIPFGGQESADF